jgi:predicted dehydrogenase
MNETVRWGIIGCGDVAENKGGPALYKADGSVLVAVMRRDLAKAQEFAGDMARHGLTGPSKSC